MPAKTKAKKKKTIKRTKPKSAKKKALKTKAIGRKPVAAKKRKIAKKTKPAKKPAKKKVKARRPTSQPRAFSLKKPDRQSGRQSGDLQGLSRIEGPDSESVAELLEEGNTFEAEVLTGVEAADAAENDGGEVQTHEVPEDDVPDEYLDKD